MKLVGEFRRNWLEVKRESAEEAALLQALPGVVKHRQHHLVPRDLGAFLGFPPPRIPRVPGLHRKAHPFQKDAACAALYQWGQLIRFDPGLGKTLTALECIRHLVKKDKAFPLLVTAPAHAGGVWVDEFWKWWPKKTVRATRIENGTSTKEIQKILAQDKLDVLVTSYELVRRNQKDLAKIPWQAFIWDEIHHLRHKSSGRSDASLTLANKRPLSFKLGLSATPIANEPANLWHLFEVIRPGALGSEYAFNQRYSVTEYNDHGYRLPPKGLNPDHADELRSRIEYLASEATTEEWAHLLPPIQFNPVRLKSRSTTQWRKILDKWDGERRMHDAALDAYFQRAGTAKIKPTLKIVEEIRRTKKHVAVITYYHDMAHEFAERLTSAGENVLLITGDVPAKKRKSMLDKASKTDSTVLVASMKSVAEALTITWIKDWVLAELSHVPLDLSQILGRGRRLGSLDPVSIWLPMLRGTADEVIASNLERKVSDANRILKAGSTERKFQEALAGRKLSRDEHIKEFMEMAQEVSTADYNPYLS